MEARLGAETGTAMRGALALLAAVSLALLAAAGMATRPRRTPPSE